MDGVPPNLPARLVAARQHTLKAPIGCVGTGLHSGRRVSLTLRPAPPGHGIIFRRTDLGRDIPARFDHVADARLATTLALPDAPEVRVGTVEHLMAAFAGLCIDNALVALDGPELPILDGSAAHLVFLIDCAGVVEQDAPRETIQIRRPVRVTDRTGFAELRPAVAAHAGGLDMTLSIDFAATAIGRQAISLRLSPDSFRHELASARTFGLAGDVAALHAAGMARGGSLDNAVVVDDDRVLNPGGLRMEREFARHKLLDAVGDLALAGAAIEGRFIAHRSGHSLNNLLLRALLADTTAWRPLATEPIPVAA
ncbi:MAG: UDP-3-O-acyl-N-acetylglucosamine deacetylase [Acetobacteraceae bacterium]